METSYIIALAVAIPLVLIPAALVWFLNVSGIWTVWKESRARQKRREKAHKEALAAQRIK